MSGTDQPISQNDIDQLLGSQPEDVQPEVSGQPTAEESVASLLGQSDIDQLLGAAIEEVKENKPEVATPLQAVPSVACVFNSLGARIKVPLNKIVPYDFRRPTVFSSIEMEHLKQQHEVWLRGLIAHLSMLLRMDMSLTLKNFSIQTYKTLLDGIPTPAHIFLFKISSLNGIGLFSIDVRLAMTIVNRMLGGKAHSAADNRFLTEIEKTLINDVIHVALNEWCVIWQEWMGGLKIDPIGVESSTRFIGSGDKSFSLLSVELEGALGDCAETIRLAFPCSMLQPIVKKLREHKCSIAPREMVDKKIVWRDTYEAIQLPLVAEWKACSYSVEKVVGLKVGEVIKLPIELLKKTELRFQNKTKFIGEVGLQNGHVSIKLTERVRSPQHE